MLICAHCRSEIHENSRFCSVCGNPVNAAPQMQKMQSHRVSAYPLPYDRAAVSAGGFGQVFGLDPRVVFLTMVVDTMLFGGQFITLGTSTLLSVPVGIVLGFITYKAQRHWYRDDRESAVIKGLIVGLLTAIPTSLPGFLTVPSGIIGLVHILHRKRRESSLVIDRRVGN
jgi:phage shock protein PspC (stress-responsive transcriptional regulator)